MSLRPFLVGAVMAIGAGPAAANLIADRQVMLHCAAQFDARAKWLDIMGHDRGASREMAARRDGLLAREARFPPIDDWHLRDGMTPPSMEDRSLTRLTGFAEAGHVAPCPADALCLACTELLGRTDRHD